MITAGDDGATSSANPLDQASDARVIVCHRVTLQICTRMSAPPIDPLTRLSGSAERRVARHLWRWGRR
jgi:hypothetical protein